MDDFTIVGMRDIGIGGVRCPCCNFLRNFGNHSKKCVNWSKLKRARLKESMLDELKNLDKE